VPTDKLTIDTPEQVHLEFMLAGIGSRFMAAFLDVLIEAVLYLVLFLLTLFWASIGFFNLSRSIWWDALLTFLTFSINWGYYAIFEALWKGQTPGKRWARIRVIKDSGRPINAFEAITRNLVRFVDFLPFFYGFGVVTMLLNAKHRRLGDYVAGPSHTLPTGGAGASFAGLTVDQFQRRTSIVEYTPASLKKSLAALKTFAAVEGLDAHGQSAQIRVERNK